jgi:hypothetical protein
MKELDDLIAKIAADSSLGAALARVDHLRTSQC